MKLRTDILITGGSAAIAVGVVLAILDEYKAIKAKGKTDRGAIRVKEEADIKRVWKAAAMIEQKIKRGDYSGKNIKDVMEDFAFYQQVIE